MFLLPRKYLILLGSALIWFCFHPSLQADEEWWQWLSPAKKLEVQSKFSPNTIPIVILFDTPKDGIYYVANRNLSQFLANPVVKLPVTNRRFILIRKKGVAISSFTFFESDREPKIWFAQDSAGNSFPAKRVFLESHDVITQEGAPTMCGGGQVRPSP